MSDIRIKTCVLGQVSTNCYLVYDDQTKEGVVIARLTMLLIF